jgi:hypothetical protein
MTGTYPNPTLSQAWAPPWIPADNNLLAATGDPYEASGASAAITAGSVYLSKIPVRSAFTATNVWFAVTTAGSGASTGSFAGLYSSAGVLLSGSADIAAQLTGSVGPIEVTLTTPQALTTGFVWVALLSNLATTQPKLADNPLGLTSIENLNLTAANFRFAINGTVQTSLPASITPASNVSAGGVNLWAGIS